MDRRPVCLAIVLEHAGDDGDRRHLHAECLPDRCHGDMILTDVSNSCRSINVTSPMLIAGMLPLAKAWKKGALDFRETLSSMATGEKPHCAGRFL